MHTYHLHIHTAQAHAHIPHSKPLFKLCWRHWSWYSYVWFWTCQELNKSCLCIKVQKAQVTPIFWIHSTCQSQWVFWHFLGPCILSVSRLLFWGGSPCWVSRTPESPGEFLLWFCTSFAQWHLQSHTATCCGIFKAAEEKLPNTVGCLCSSKHKANCN